jgi:hypothetical protein
MKRKEIKNLAKKIAQAELIIRNSNDPIEIQEAKDEIMRLSCSVRSMEDMLALDEAIQDYMAENS